MGNRAGLRLDNGRAASVVLPLLKKHPSRYRNHVPHRQIQEHALLVLHHNGKLLAVVVYKKGAEAIVQALEQILIDAVTHSQTPCP